MVMQGQSPYAALPFYNPIWALIPFIPLTILPLPFARDLWSIISAVCLTFALIRFRIKQEHIALILFLSPALALIVLWGNLDALVLLGATLTPIIGIWFVLLKPQIGLFVALLWIYKAVQSRRWLYLAALVIPISIALTIQFALFGVPHVIGLPSTAAVWPWGIGALLALIAAHQIHADEPSALLAGPLVSPYLNVNSWIAIVPFLAQRSRRVVIAGSLLSWLAFVFWLAIGKQS